MNTQETTEAVFHALLDPSADPIESARSLGLSLTAFLEIAESPQVTEAIEALERIAEIRTRALLARSAHTAIEALERIAASDPQTPGATETCRKAAAQLLRMAAKQPGAPDAHRAHGESGDTPLPRDAEPTPAAGRRPPQSHDSHPPSHSSGPVPRGAADRYRLPGRMDAPSPAPAQT